MKIGLNGYPAGCGWFCRRLHDVKDVLDFVAPSVSTRISKVLLMFNVDANDFSFKIAELSIQDQNILDEWYKTKFEPFTINISKLLKSIDIQKTAIQKVTIINELQSQLCLVELYHNLLEIPFLSMQGKAEMNKLIYEFSTAFSNELALELAKHKTTEIKASLPFKTISPIILEPLKSLSQYKCFQYVLARIDEPVDEIPVDEIPVDTNNPVDEIPIDINNPVATIDETKKSGFNWWWLVAGFVGYKILK